MEKTEVWKRIKEDKIKFIQLQFTDLFGIVKSLTIPTTGLENALVNGVWFDGSSILGFARIYESDMYLVPDMSTYAVIPWLRSETGNTARFLCDVHNPDGSPFEGDPRYILKRALREADEMGMRYKTGPEMEFFLFRTDNGLKPLPHDQAGYFDLTTDEAYKIRGDMSLALEEFGIEIETAHHEVSIGQHEISFKYGDALQTADNAMTLRFVVKAIAQMHGLHATFMPKPLAEVNGSGMHVHQSFIDKKTGLNLFYNEKDQYKLSEMAYNYIAGQLDHIKAMSSILSPTVNSYKRLVPGYEAPVYICWGRTNRSALIRVPGTFKNNPQSTRLELRSADPSSNIYLVFAVMLASGLDGIRRKLQPSKPLEEDIYLFNEEKLEQLQIETIPHNLWQALKALKKDEIIQKALGEHTYKNYIEAKTLEWDDYSRHVSQWELDKYLERY